MRQSSHARPAERTSASSGALLDRPDDATLPAPDGPAPTLDPRVARSRAAVLSAATELLVDGGPGAVTIDAIVARSGVAKSTIYRHWGSRDDILLDVMEVCAPDVSLPEAELGVDAGLRELAHRTADMFNHPEWARVLPALIMLRVHEDGIADLERRMEDRRREVFGVVVQRGIDEHILSPDAAQPEAQTSFIGPLLFAYLSGLPLDHGFVERTVDRFMAIYAA